MKRIILLSISIVLMLSLFSCDDDTTLTPKNETTISGTIVSLSDNSNIVDAVVSAMRGEVVISSDTSDENGNFSLKSIPENFSNISLKIEHKILGNKIMKLSDGMKNGKLLLELTNDSCCGEINILVKDSENFNIIENAHVKIAQSRNWSKSKLTNSSGIANFKELCEGSYLLRVFKDGYKVVEEDFDITNCDPKNITILLERKESTPKDSCCDGVFKLFIKDSTSNNAIPNAAVKLWAGGKIIADGKTNSDGYILFKDLCEGSYGVSYFVGNKSYEFTFNITCNDTLIYTKYVATQTPCCDSKFILYLKDKETQNAISGAKVKLFLVRDMISEQYSSANGYVGFGNLCEGKYEVLVYKDGYKDFSFFFHVSCSDTLEWIKQLDKKNIPNDSCNNGKVKVWVKDSSNKAIANVEAKLMQGEKLIAYQKTNGHGFLYFENLKKGEYKIIIYLADGSVQYQYINLGCDEFKIIEFIATKGNDDKKDCHTAILKLRIKDKDKAQYIDSAEVKMELENRIAYSTTSNSDGWAIIENITAPRKYKVTISKQGYETFEFWADYKECKLLQETIILKAK